MSNGGSRFSTRHVLCWLRDRVWATLDDPSEQLDRDTEQPTPELDQTADEHVVRSVFERLSAELADEADRRRAVEAKLVAAGSVAPIAVAIMAAIATFLSSGHAHDFTAASVIVVCSTASYVALQFLRAMLSAIRGLSRRSYAAPTVSSILSESGEGATQYLRNASNALARQLEQHRETTNEKVSQLALAHVSIVNAVTMLIIAMIVLSGITISESLR